MNVLFFGDIHGNTSYAKEIAKKADSADLLVCTGDLSTAGEGFGEVLKIIAQSNKTILLIPGNNETPEFVETGSDEYDNVIPIHGEVYEDKHIRFLGIGGGTVSPFNTVFEISDEQFNNLLSKDYGKIDVLVSHTPPKETTLDETKTKLHVGSFPIGKWIEKNKPKYCACGHIHENAGKEIKIGKTICFNPGPLGRIIKI